VDTAERRDHSACRAVAYQRVLHQLVRRELRLLGELATWAPAGEAERTAALTRHADLIGRVLLHHHTVEREAVWPALLRAVPGDRIGTVRAALDDWTDRCARVDHMLRDLSTAARQWQVAGAAPARDAFALACLALADAVDAQTAEEEAALLPLLGEHLQRGHWAAIARSAARRTLAGSARGLAAARPPGLPGGRRPAARRPAGAVIRRQWREVPQSVQRLRTTAVSAWQLSQTQVVRSLVVVLMAVSPSSQVHRRR
jgi:hypothetical protein